MVSPAKRQAFPGNVVEAASRGAEDNDRLTDLHAHELSANTRKNYRVQWTGFVNWAQSRGFCALPAAPDVVAAYLAERFEMHGHKPATLRLAASAIGHFHRVAKLDNPSESGKVRSTLSGATRKAGLLQKQARGLTESDLDAIKKSACRPRRSRGGHLETEETARRRGEVDIAIVSLMRDCLLRVSEAAAARRCDIEQMEDDTGRLLIRRSKTDQEGKSAKAFISRATMAAIRCIRNGAEEEEDSVFGLRRNQISKSHQAGRKTRRAWRRLQRSLPACGHGDRPCAIRNRTSKTHGRRALAITDDAGSLHSKRIGLQRGGRAIPRRSRRPLQAIGEAQHDCAKVVHSYANLSGHSAAVPSRDIKLLL